MLENTESIETEKEKRKYIEIVIKQYRPPVFGVLSTLCLILASLEIVAGIFFVFSLAFLMATIISILTAQKRSTRKLRLI